MTYSEAQAAMAQIFEQLQVLEVKIQKAEKDLADVSKRKQDCKEAAEEALKQLKICRDEQLVFADKYVELQRNLFIVTRYLSQAEALERATKIGLTQLQQQSKRLQGEYDSLNIHLAKAGNNIIYPAQWHQT